jgi:hypothetical protein
MMANSPKIPMPEVFSTDTTAARLAAAVAIGLVQLDSAMVVDDDGPGLEEAEAAGTAGGVATWTASAATAPSNVGACEGVRVGAGAGRTGTGATRGAAGATDCTGAGAGAGAAGTGAGAEEVGAGAAVVGAGETDGDGVMGTGDSVHSCCRQAAWAAPAAPDTAVKASMAAAIPGSSAPRSRVIPIMKYLCVHAGHAPAPSFIPGIFLQPRAGHQIGCRRLATAGWLLPTFRR